MDLQRLVDIDKQLLLTLNGSDSLYMDGVMKVYTTTIVWIPVALILLFIVLKNSTPRTALLTVLAQPNPDTLIIMAGYQDEMDRMMRVNQGLQGRFPHKFHFDDYSEEELMQIATAMLDKNGYSLDTAAREELLKGIDEACKNKDQFFSNARWMGQVVMKGMLPAMSARIMSSNFIADKETFTTIKEEDVRSALDKFRFTSVKSVKNEKRQSIGFAV